MRNKVKVVELNSKEALLVSGGVFDYKKTIDALTKLNNSIYPARKYAGDVSDVFARLDEASELENKKSVLNGLIAGTVVSTVLCIFFYAYRSTIIKSANNYGLKLYELLCGCKYIAKSK